MKILKILGLVVVVVGMVLAIPYVKELVSDDSTTLGKVKSTNKKTLQLLDSIVMLDGASWNQEHYERLKTSIGIAEAHKLIDLNDKQTLLKNLELTYIPKLVEVATGFFEEHGCELISSELSAIYEELNRYHGITTYRDKVATVRSRILDYYEAYRIDRTIEYYTRNEDKFQFRKTERYARAVRNVLSNREVLGYCKRLRKSLSFAINRMETHHKEYLNAEVSDFIRDAVDYDSIRLEKIEKDIEDYKEATFYHTSSHKRKEDMENTLEYKLAKYKYELEQNKQKQTQDAEKKETFKNIIILYSDNNAIITKNHFIAIDKAISFLDENEDASEEIRRGYSVTGLKKRLEIIKRLREYKENRDWLSIAEFYVRQGKTYTKDLSSAQLNSLITIFRNGIGESSYNNLTGATALGKMENYIKLYK